MTGTFAALQAVYAAHHVATYPLTEGKTPAVRGYDHVGLQGSRQLALRFAAADAFGFAAGPRNRLCVVDIDSADDRLVAEIQARFGATPLQVITPSGGRHLYYRHGGEPRRIRPLPDVDVLGAGNVVAAGSIVAKGRYQIERGSLDDLDRLPAMTRGAAPARARIEEGHRNVELFNYCRGTVACCDTLEQLIDAAETWAGARLASALPVAEIRKTATSVWMYRGGRKRVIEQFMDPPQYAALIANTDALALFAYLSAENGSDAEFMIADGLATARGWPRRFVPAARQALINMGIVECVRTAAPGRPALYRWRHP